MDLDPIKVDGLREFQRTLRALDAGLPRTLRLAHNEAAKIVVDWAQPRVPARTGKARASVRATSSQREARVTGGGKRVPYYPWLDFGGRVGRNRTVQRPFQKAAATSTPATPATRTRSRTRSSTPWSRSPSTPA